MASGLSSSSSLSAAAAAKNGKIGMEKKKSRCFARKMNRNKNLHRIAAAAADDDDHAVDFSVSVLLMMLLS